MEPNLVPLQEKPVPLSAESALQPGVGVVGGMGYVCVGYRCVYVWVRVYVGV